jgi:5-methylcytosine-specific restriction protein B
MSDSAPGYPSLSEHPVRQLSAADLGRVVTAAPSSDSEPPPTSESGLPSDDRVLQDTLELIDIYGGVIFTGPPGTSKSWYAREVALALVKGNEQLVRFVQFHPSYQYEDFVQGYVPTDAGRFVLQPKHLLEMCDRAVKHPGEWVVLVIDELSRGDPGRVFGEALTYVEKTKRELEFHLAAGDACSIPGNLLFLATMNPLDRGVDEVDAAFERRFAKISMEPDPELLAEHLAKSGMPEDLQERVLTFFRTVNGRTDSNPFAAIGHTYFFNVGDEAGLRSVWNHQLRYLFEKAYRLDPDGYSAVIAEWNKVVGANVDQAAPESTEAPDQQ